jgi:hypothetical protein
LKSPGQAPAILFLSAVIPVMADVESGPTKKARRFRRAFSILDVSLA